MGEVVLPGPDLGMADDEWDWLGPLSTGDGRTYHCESHPQFQLKLLLDRMGVGRGEVVRWRWGGGKDAPAARTRAVERSEEHTSELQSLMRISYAVFCLKKKIQAEEHTATIEQTAK